MKRLCAAALVFAALTSAHAAKAQHRELSAHEHGHGTVNIAIEGKRLMIELIAPGADIVGFEHAARTDADKAAIAAAKKDLQAFEKIVVLPPAAGCTKSAASVEMDWPKAVAKANAGSPGEAQHGAAEHGAFNVTYEFNCADMAGLTGMEFGYFRLFSGARELDVSVIGAKGQKQFEVTRDAPRISLGGIL